MADFDPTTPQIRLFDEVDLAPAPQTSILQRALSTWRDQRADQLLPSADSVIASVASNLAPHTFVARLQASSGDFSLSSAGTQAAAVFDCDAANTDLSDIGNRRVAVYARHLFCMVKQRREAISVRFNVREKDGKRHTYEMLAAPVDTSEGNGRIFGAVAALQ